MYRASEQFNTEIMQLSRRFCAKIVIGSSTITTGIIKIKFTGGSNGGEDITIGSAVSQAVEISVKSDLNFTGKEIAVHIGLRIGEQIEYVPMGVYVVEKPSKSSGVVSFTAHDRMISKGELLYTSGLTFPNNSKNVLNEICAQMGIAYATQLTGIAIQEKPSGYTRREVVSYIAGLHGKFACINRTGNLELKWYEDNSYAPGASRINEPEVQESDYILSKISCAINQDNTIESGTGSGMNISNPLMTQAVLDNVVKQLNGFRFRPGRLQIRLGDVRLDPWDLITVRYGSEVLKIPSMTLTHDYDGGVSTEIIAVGKTTTEQEYNYKGPTATAIDRAYTELFLVNKVVANKIDAEEADIKFAKIKELEATNAKVETIVGDFADFKSGEFEDLKAKQATFQETTTKKFTAVTAQIETVTGDFASFKTGEFETLKSKQAAFEEATAQKFTAANGNIDNLTGQFATFKDLTTTNFTAVTGNIKDLTVESQRVKTLLAGNITSDNIATGAITAGSGIIAQGAIGDAEISSLSANKIKSGTVDTSLVTIASIDSAITITGNQLMVNDTTNAVSPINRVILGKYTNGSATTYGLLIRGKDGKTVMLDGDGVHNAGITNGAVDNNKVADDANISGNKLDINSVVRSVNGATEKIHSTVVQVGDRSLNVYLGEQTNTITEHGESLRTQAASIKAAQDSIKLKLDTQTWTTAKEEIDGKISKNTSNLSKATSDITVLQGQITSKVEQTDINKAVESITIGGRNIAISDGIVTGGGQTIFDKSRYFESGTIVFDRRAIANGGIILDKADIYEVSTKYVLRFKAKLNSGSITNIYFHNGQGMLNTSIFIDGIKQTYGYDRTINCDLSDKNYHEIVVYFTTPATLRDSSGTNYTFFQPMKSDASATYNVTITELKIEKGTKFTDWTPPVEDVNAAITAIGTTTTESIKTAKSEIKQTTDAITQNVSNLQTTVSTHTTQIGNKAETSTVTAISNRTASLETKLTGITGKVTDYVSTTVTNSTKDLVTGLETVNGSIETINSKQAGFELTLSGFATDVSNLEKTVEKKADGSALSTLSSTVSSLSSNLDGFKTSVSSTYTTKTELSNTLGSYSTTKQMNNAIEATKTAITSSVSETYSTKAELTTATGKITALETWKQEASQKITKDGIVATVGSYYAKDTDLTAAENRITSVETKATQTADKFNWIVKSGTSATDFTITDRLISLATARIDLSAANLVNIISGGSAKIQAKNITLDGVVTANSNFKILADGSVEAVNGKFSGKVTTDEGNIGGWVIKPGSMTRSYSASGKDHWLYFDTGTTDQSYAAMMLRTKASTASVWEDKFSITWGGRLLARDADITGTIRANNGSVAGFTINGSRLDGNPTSEITALHLFANDAVFEAGQSLSQKYAFKAHTHNVVNNGYFDVAQATGDSNGGTFSPTLVKKSGSIHLGYAGLLWSRLYAANATISTSDANEKTDIHSIDERYERMFMDLKPVNYRWANRASDDNHDRVHCGLVAQEVEASALKHGLSSDDFATICKDRLDVPTADGRTTVYGLAYSELHGLEIHMIQKNAKAISDVKHEIIDTRMDLLNKINGLQADLNQERAERSRLEAVVNMLQNRLSQA